MNHDVRIAVLVPCHNEALAVGTVVNDFRSVLPDRDLYVYDNNSTDDTVEMARQAGAVVRHETAQAKATSCAGCSPTSTPTST